MKRRSDISYKSSDISYESKETSKQESDRERFIRSLYGLRINKRRIEESPPKIVGFQTDRGNTIIGYREYSEKKGRKIHEKSLQNLPHILEKYGLTNKAVIKEISDHRFNCHSYTFTRGVGGWLSEKHVRTILTDNQYKLVPFEQARVGDVVLYHDRKGQLQHSGFISQIVEGEISVTSKWGIAAILEHNIHAVLPGYGNNITIYRG